MITVNRNNFIAWTQGLLLDRAGDKILSIGDDVAHEHAAAALDNGETIALTIRGEVVSTMRLEDNGYTESLVGVEDQP